MPPDPDLVDLVEQAFVEGQIDSQKAELAYLWMMTHRADLGFVPNLSHGVLNARQGRAN